MFISVDLPAPFSPTTPWMVPRGICRSTFLLAWTGPKRLSMPTSSTAGGASAGARRASLAACAAVSAKRPRPVRDPLLLGRIVVRDLELAADDLLLRLLEPGLH